MILFPKHPVTRRIAAAWLFAAAVLLVAMLLRPEFQLGERRALSSLVALYFLSFPLGHAGLLGVNRLKLELYLSNEFVPDILSEGLLLWMSLTVLGYVQWFVLLPFISRRIGQLCDAYAARRAAPR